MRIFSNFDTQLDDELYRKAVENFGEEKVMIVRRSTIYIWLKIIVPGAISMLIIATMMYVERRLEQMSNMSPIVTIIGMIVIIISLIVWLWYTIRKLMDYYMDFAIITPRQIVSYQQRGLFRRSSISLDLTNLRSINEEKNWILKSIFNYGTVVFLSEWWDYRQVDDPDAAIDASMIKLNYITYPRKLREKILHIVRD